MNRSIQLDKVWRYNESGHKSNSFHLSFTFSADLFEGDLKLSKEEIEQLKGNTISKKDTVAAANRRWPGARVPYTIDRSFNGMLTAAAVAKFDHIISHGILHKIMGDRTGLGHRR